MLASPMPASAAIPSNNVPACHPVVMSDRNAPSRYVTGL